MSEEIPPQEIAALYRQAPIGLCYFDSALRFVHINEWLAAINGFSVEEHLGRTLEELLPGVASGAMTQPRQVVETGEPVIDGEIEATTAAHPEEVRVYRHSYFPRKNTDGTVLGVSCSVKDITERRTLSALASRVEAENVYLQEQLDDAVHRRDVIGKSVAWQNIMQQVGLVAGTDSSVLIQGETGTGKELIAQAIHDQSPRCKHALVKVDCASLPSTLIESELFGHEKGAFTGALQRRAGRFEIADGGTIFLDEISELPLDLQSRLLRVLQEREFQRLGSKSSIKVDVRVVTATNRNLAEAVDERRFRSDLYFRLAVFPIELPPLRKRTEDIPILAWYFVERNNARRRIKIDTISEPAMNQLIAYDWPGNVRELENLVERACILSPGQELRIERDIRSPDSTRDTRSERLEDAEREHILSVLQACGGTINGAGNAADRLGINPSTLRSRMKKLGITRPT
ncbi:MAG TPA: sigma 54-interacting transcriptional regulator [Acidobacteriota bacterium]|nr:sigma 54-interacting transcriptional regulator [Acidobacteriota bacterium]